MNPVQPNRVTSGLGVGLDVFKGALQIFARGQLDRGAEPAPPKAKLGEVYQPKKDGEGINYISTKESDRFSVSLPQDLDKNSRVHILGGSHEVLDTGKQRKDGSFVFAQALTEYPPKAMLLVETPSGRNYHIPLHKS
jgi:hypothetical protein